MGSFRIIEYSGHDAAKLLHAISLEQPLEDIHELEAKTKIAQPMGFTPNPEPDEDDEPEEDDEDEPEDV